MKELYTGEAKDGKLYVLAIFDYFYLSIFNLEMELKMKVDLCTFTGLYSDRYDTDRMTIEELKVLIWRYCISYWNSWKTCSDSGILPHMLIKS